MSRISTHVLDIAQGRPAKDVPVRLERRDANGDWALLVATRTDADGRCVQMLPVADVLLAGIYRLVFDTASYLLAQNLQSLYPVVEITFQVREGESSFHIPLLLSPHGYTTYRGN
jgi:5-hydroxyisourate hydrolase